MSAIIIADYAPITHNGHVQLTPEGRHKRQKELARYRFAEFRERYPNAELIDIRFGGVPYAGFRKA